MIQQNKHFWHWEEDLDMCRDKHTWPDPCPPNLPLPLQTRSHRLPATTISPVLGNGKQVILIVLLKEAGLLHGRGLLALDGPRVAEPSFGFVVRGQLLCVSNAPLVLKRQTLGSHNR